MTTDITAKPAGLQELSSSPPNTFHSSSNNTPMHQFKSPPVQTPPPPSPRSNSRFKFHSDTKAPSELTKLEQQTARNVTAFRTRLNELDKKIASWNAKFSTEVVDRDRDMVGLLDYVCIDPLERSSERFVYRLNQDMNQLWGHQPDNYDDDDDDDESSDDDEEENYDHVAETEDQMIMTNRGDEDDDGATMTASATTTAVTTLDTSKDETKSDQTSEKIQNVASSSQIALMPCSSEDQDDDDDGNNEELLSTTRPSVESLQKDISTLSSDLNQFIYKSTPSLMKKHLYDLQTQVQTQIPSYIQMEKFKASKREQSIHQKFESMAGLTSKSFAEESAVQHAELKLLRNKVLEAGGWDELRTSRFLKEIQEIRNGLQKEREERIEKDELVLKKIVDTRETLQRTLLDSLAK